MYIVQNRNKVAWSPFMFLQTNDIQQKVSLKYCIKRILWLLSSLVVFFFCNCDILRKSTKNATSADLAKLCDSRKRNHYKLFLIDKHKNFLGNEKPSTLERNVSFPNLYFKGRMQKELSKSVLQVGFPLDRYGGAPTAWLLLNNNFRLSILVLWQ